jgi:hypothetical protein
MTKWIKTDEIPTDKFAILEITTEDAVVSPTMEYQELSECARQRYASQTLESFNNSKNIWIINITRQTIRPLSIRLEI